MYKLLRPHHSLFLLDNETLCTKFKHIAEQNPHISLLLSGDGGTDMLFQWRLTFNMWISLRTKDEDLYDDFENVMIYPTVHYILQLFNHNTTITVFKNNYRKDELLVFISALFIVNECSIWYKSMQLPHDILEPSSEALMNTDFYQLFQNNKKQGKEQVPRVLAESLTAFFKDIKHKVTNDKQYFMQLIDKAISDAKKMNSFFVEVVGDDVKSFFQK